jgi:hypothetical protein
MDAKKKRKLRKLDGSVATVAEHRMKLQGGT